MKIETHIAINRGLVGLNGAFAIMNTLAYITTGSNINLLIGIVNTAAALFAHYTANRLELVKESNRVPVKEFTRRS